MSPGNIEYFIDSHCHMFTIADIPLYQPVKQAVHDQTRFPKRLLFPLLSFYLPLLKANDAVKNYEKFIRSFEKEPVEAVQQLVQEVEEILKAQGTSDFRLSPGCTILTPLVMDFDHGANVKKLRYQVDRLVGAIKAVSPSRVMILPFIGIDPQGEDSDQWLSTAVSVRARGGVANVNNGDLIGVKLYPPLGFNPGGYLDFYRKIAAKDLPVTVHCQKASLKLVDNAEALADPQNWAEILKKMENDQKQLTINFAHFGGDDEVARTIEFRKRDEDTEPGAYPQMFNDVCKNTWTFRIIEMLKKYPNTYADLSAFDFTCKPAVAALKWILQLDSTHGLGVEHDNYSLMDKLLWGSDYPMTLKAGNLAYRELFLEFIEAIKRGKDDVFQYPDHIESITSDDFVERLVCNNPQRFLGL